MIVFQPSIKTLGCTPFTVTSLFRYAVPNASQPLRLLRQFLLQLGIPARIDIDDRNMADITAVLLDRRIVVGAVHQIIQVGDPPGGHGGEWNGELAVMHGCGREHATDGDTAVRAVDMQFVADPGFLVSLGIALDTDIAVPR